MPRKQAGESPPDTERGVDALTETIEQLGGEAHYVTVFKHDPGRPGSRTGWGSVARYLLSDFDPWEISGTFGPGLYKFDFHSDGRGKVRSVQQRFIEPERDDRRPPPPSPASSSTPGAGGMPDWYLQHMLATSERQQEMFSQLMVTIAGALANREPGGGSTADLLKAFEVGRDSGKGPMPHELMAEALKTGMQLGAKAAGRGGDDTLGGLGTKALEVLDTLMKRTTSQPGTPPRRSLGAGANPAPPAGAPRGAATSDAGAVPPPAAAEASGSPLTPLQGALVEMRPHILAAARAGRDPYTFGRYVADNSGEEWYPTLREFAAMDDAARAALLAEHAPDLAPHADWIREACEGIADMLADDDSADAAGKGATNGDSSQESVPGGELDPDRDSEG